MPDEEGANPAIVVDGSNIAYLVKTPEGKASLEALLTVRDKLREMGYRPIIIVDASLHHHIDNPRKLDQLIDSGEINQAPADTDADVFVLKTARDFGARIVTDDQYKDYRDSFEHAREKRAPVMIVDGVVEFYDLPPARGSRPARRSRAG